MTKPPSTDEIIRQEALDLLANADLTEVFDAFQGTLDTRPTPLPIPRRLGRYLVRRRLGMGGMAEVFLADRQGPAGFSKKVVLKRLLPHLAMDERFVELFAREARIVAGLSHPNVVQVFELGEEGGQYFLAMEYIDGITLHQLARRLWGASKPLPLEVSLRAVADAALGLHHAHERGIVHRDVSPDNLIITKGGITKVLDFGIARPEDAESLTKTGEAKGKVAFMAPEVLRGERPDRRADLYALGVSLYWLLTGRRPFAGASDYVTMDLALRHEAAPPSEVAPSVPPEIDALVMKLLDKDPDARFQTGEELHRALSDHLAIDTALSQCVVEHALALPERPVGEVDDPCDAPISTASAARPRKSRALRIPLAAAALVVLGVTFAIVASSSGDTSSADPFARAASAPAATTAGAAVAAADEHAAGDAAADAAADDQTAGDQTAGDQTADAAAADDAAAGAPADAAAADDAAHAAAAGAPADDAAADDAAHASVADDAAHAAAAGAPADDAAGATADDAAASHRAAAGPSARAARLRVKAPARIVWRSMRGRPLLRGSGTLALPAGAKHVVAFDPEVWASTIVPVGRPVDYDRLPHGTLDVRALPYAHVYLGHADLGVTPLKPKALVAGIYWVKLVYGKKVVSRRVRVPPGRVGRLAVRMTD